MITDAEDIQTDDAGPGTARGSGPKSKRPGKLRGIINTKFHTGEAYALIDGRGPSNGKSVIIGLKGFARKSTLILDSSERGDPFADSALIQIESKLDEVEQQMRDRGAELRDLSEQRLDPGVTPEHTVAFETRTWSVEPVEEEFVLGHYSSRGLVCLVQYDQLVLLAKGLLHHQVISRDECRQTVDTAGNWMRGLFAIGDSYQFTGVTRTDLQAKNRVAREAVESLVSRRFIDPRLFDDLDEIIDTFAHYSEKPKFGRGPGPEDDTSPPDATPKTDGAGKKDTPALAEPTEPAAQAEPETEPETVPEKA